MRNCLVEMVVWMLAVIVVPLAALAVYDAWRERREDKIGGDE